MSTLPLARSTEERPLLRFESTACEDKVASEQTGRTEYMDLIKVYVRAPGDMKTEVVFEARKSAYDITEKEVEIEKEITHHVLNEESGETEERKEKVLVKEPRKLYQKKTVFPWLDILKERLRNKQISEDYFRYCKDSFDRFVENREGPLDGTPLKEWAGVNEGVKKKAIEMGINTIELLAELSEEGITSLGMGARNAKTAAQAYLQRVSNIDVDATKAVRLEQDNAEMREQMEAMQKQLTALEAKKEEVKGRATKKKEAA